jgi:MFS family permease
MAIKTSSLNARLSYSISPVSFFLLLVLLIYTYAITVYIIPIIVNQEIEGSFDAFGYAKGMVENAEHMRELQQFLNIYPEWSEIALFIYAPLLHLFLILPVIFILKNTIGRKGLVIIISAVAIPESLIFFSAVSKEGLGIVAVLAAVGGIIEINQNKKFWGSFLCIYAILIAEISRPLFGIVFSFSIIVGLIPVLKPNIRLILYIISALVLILSLWLILVGTYSEIFTEKYQSVKQFLDWFETDLKSESFFKNLMRKFFAVAFEPNEPLLFTIFIIIVFAFFKTIIYLLAIPLISLPNFANMPAQTWALTWQVATSISSILMVIGLFSLRKYELSKESKSLLVFGFCLAFMIAISTAIFHVRYRAPSVIAILLAIWLIAPLKWPKIIWINILCLMATLMALFSTSY